MEQHQNRKVEIDARDDSFDDVVKMGKDLIARNHYATPEVKNYYLLWITLSYIWEGLLCAKESRLDHFKLVNYDSEFRVVVGGQIICYWLLLVHM